MEIKKSKTFLRSLHTCIICCPKQRIYLQKAAANRLFIQKRARFQSHGSKICASHNQVFVLFNKVGPLQSQRKSRSEQRGALKKPVIFSRRGRLGNTKA